MDVVIFNKIDLFFDRSGFGLAVSDLCPPIFPFGLFGSVFSLLGSVFSLFRSGFSPLGSVFSLLGSVFSLLGSCFGPLGSVFGLLGSVFSPLGSGFGPLGSVFSLFRSGFSPLGSGFGLLGSGFGLPIFPFVLAHVCSSSQAISIGTNICIDQQSILRSYNLVQTFDLEHLTEGTFSPSGDQIKWFDARKGQMAVTHFTGTTTYKLSN